MVAKYRIERYNFIKINLLIYFSALLIGCGSNKTQSNYSNEFIDSIYDGGYFGNLHYIPFEKQANFFEADQNYTKLYLMMIYGPIDSIKMNELYSLALAKYTKALENREGDDFYILVNRADCKILFNDYYGALEDYNLILRDNSRKFESIRLMRGFCLIKTRQIEEAFNVFNSFIDEQVSEKKKKELVLAQKQMNKESKSKNFLFVDISDEKALAGAYYYRGLIYLIKKDQLNACMDFSKASQTDPKVSVDVAIDAIKKYCNSNAVLSK